MSSQNGGVPFLDAFKLETNRKTSQFGWIPLFQDKPFSRNAMLLFFGVYGMGPTQLKACLRECLRGSNRAGRLRQSTPLAALRSLSSARRALAFIFATTIAISSLHQAKPSKGGKDRKTTSHDRLLTTKLLVGRADAPAGVSGEIGVAAKSCIGVHAARASKLRGSQDLRRNLRC